jgi:hypothetical protein
VFGATNGSKPAGQYGGSKPAGQVTSAAATPAAAARSTLPFTGADVGAVVLAALILLLLGAVLRRSTREQG